jgi:ferredoxin
LLQAFLKQGKTLELGWSGYYNNAYAYSFIGRGPFNNDFEERLMQKMLHIDANKCTGCLQCEMACSFENYGIFAPAKSRHQGV